MHILDRLLWKLVDAAIFCAVIGMVVFVSIQVGSRAFGHSIPWTEELSRFLFIWTTFLGMATGFRHGTHPSLGLLAEGLAPEVQRYLRLLTPLAAFAFFGIVGFFALRLLQQQIRYGEISPILQVGMWITTLPLVLGAILAPIGAVADIFLAPAAVEDWETEKQ